MAGSLGMVLAGTMLFMLLGIESARAASGRIVFAGAVVEPTCAVQGNEIKAASRARGDNGLVVGRATCGRTSTDPGRSYAHTLVALDAASIANDRLLAYFAGYANVEGAAPAKLVTRTYE